MDSNILFCKTCHVFIGRYIQDKDGTQMLHNGKPYGAKFSGNIFSIGKEGKKIQGLPVQCSRGHINYIEDSVEQIEEKERLQYNFGQVCPYHDNVGSVCNVRYPCDKCIVYENYKRMNI